MASYKSLQSIYFGWILLFLVLLTVSQIGADWSIPRSQQPEWRQWMFDISWFGIVFFALVALLHFIFYGSKK